MHDHLGLRRGGVIPVADIGHGALQADQALATENIGYALSPFLWPDARSNYNRSSPEPDRSSRCALVACFTAVLRFFATSAAVWLGFLFLSPLWSHVPTRADRHKAICRRVQNQGKRARKGRLRINAR